MQIKIEIEVQPEELRRFLGLPDVAGLQEEVINYLRDKVSEANENFDPATFVKTNLDTFLKGKAVKRILYGSRTDEDTESPAKSRKKTVKTSTGRRRSAAKRKSAGDD